MKYKGLSTLLVCDGATEKIIEAEKELEKDSEMKI